MEYCLETDRLKLREFVPADNLFIVELVNSPEWLKYIGDKNIKTAEQAESYLINGPISSYKMYGFGLALVELKSNSKPIGMCGILKRPDLEKPDIGFAFLPEYIGKGFGYEIASATLNHAREVLKQQTILAITIPDNKSSIKLLEKIGMVFQKNIVFPNQETELLLYSTKSAL